MLQSIRDRLSGPIVWFVIGLICIPFAFWGIESFKGGSSDPILAKVGDHEITQAEFRQGYEQRYQQLQQLMGENFRPEMIDQARFRKSVLNDMVQEAALRQYTHTAGYRASDAAVLQYLSSVPAFQDNGKFSETIYRDLLSRRGMSPGSFEGQLRESLVIDQLRESISDSAFVTDDEALLAYRISGQSRDIGVAVLPVEKFKATAVVSEDQVAKRYEEEKTSHMAPERLKLAYVDLDLASMPKAPDPGADVLKAIYDAEKDSRFASAEERKARHILISFGADKAQSEAKIEKLAEQLKGGASFADLAKQNSDDPGSKAAGGDLGWVKRGMMTKAFEDALFELKSGETSGPVQTEFGWHLIHVDEVKPPAVQAFESAEVQSELLDVYRSRDAQKRFQEQAEKLEQLAFENPASLDPVAQALGLQVKTTDWFARTGGSGIAAEAAVKTAAFSPEVLTEGENSKPLSLGASRVVVIRKGEYEAPRQLTLEEVASDIRDELKLAAAKEQARSKSQDLLKALRGGASLETAAADVGADVVQDGLVKRVDAKPDRAVIEAAFKLPRPGASGPSIGDVSLANGDLAVIALRKVEEPSVADAGNATRDLAAQLKNTVAGAEFGAMRQALEKELKVEITAPQAGTPAAAPELEGGG